MERPNVWSLTLWEWLKLNFLLYLADKNGAMRSNFFPQGTNNNNAVLKLSVILSTLCVLINHTYMLTYFCAIVLCACMWVSTCSTCVSVAHVCL